jgi:hypothetical protein
MRKTLLSLLALSVIGLVWMTVSSTPAPAETVTSFDHLKCYKLAYSKKKDAVWTPIAHAKDALTLTPITTLSGFKVETGCELLPRKSPRPRELCTPVDKQPRQPPGGTGLSNDLLCYAMRCPVDDDFNLAISDQFGSGQAIVKRNVKMRRICVPSPIAIPG